MWGIVHNLIDPGKPVPSRVECSCGWRGRVAEFRQHVSDVEKAAREKIIDFVDYVDGEIKAGAFLRGDIDDHPTKWGFIRLAAFATLMHNLGFKKANA